MWNTSADHTPRVREQVAHAIGLLNEGHDPEVVQEKLIEGGLTREEAGGLVGELLMQAVYTDAVDQFNKGKSAKQVEQHLVSKGLEQESASMIVRDIVIQNMPQPQPQESVKGVLLKLVGGFVFVVGIGLLIGNVTGAFPTFPYAGFLVMGIGSAIWGVS